MLTDTTAQVALPPKLIPVFVGDADVRGAFGGRGSGKTRSFAKMTAVRAHMWDQAGREGLILCGREFMNSLEDSSLEEIKAAIRSEPWLLPHFDIGEKYIRTASGRISYTFSGLDRNIDSIKSKSRILLGWVDEAEPVSEEAWIKLIPTLREDDSELWVTWNPERETSATHKRFRLSNDPRYKIIELNWRDNPRFPSKLERDRRRDKEERPEQYEHIWEGGFKTAVEGAYYAQDLTTAKDTGRVTNLALDPLMTIRAYWDIGGTGAKADATAIWVCQFIGKHIYVLDYYEARHQPLSAHLAWLRKRGYSEAYCILPHDGGSGEKIIDATYESAIKSAGFEAKTIPNQGTGAASMRVEAGRRLFPRIWFDDKNTKPGRTALGWYHEKQDEKRGIGLGAEHDWASHGADAFGLMCVDYEEPTSTDMPQVNDDWVR
jgi:phage terminase large subunit